MLCVYLVLTGRNMFGLFGHSSYTYVKSIDVDKSCQVVAWLANYRGSRFRRVPDWKYMELEY